MKRTYLVLIITMLVVGFAAVATNLAINGTINFGFNQNDFDSNVVFTYTNTMNGTATIAENGKAITFNTTKLENVGQQAIMDFDIANKSSQYDASVTIKCGLESGLESYSDYIEIKHDLGDSAFNINSGDTKSGRLTVTLKKAYNESLEKDINMLCTIIATAGERNTEGTYTPVVHQYEEILLHGSDPVLEATTAEEIALTAETSNKNLIPVIIGENGKVTRADTTDEWYDYENKEWANAVILNEGEEDPGANKEIPESSIESYFVWIPKYKYKIQTLNESNQGQEKEFEIEFGTENTSDDVANECATPNKSGESGKCKEGDWMTHPAFTAFPNAKGMWVAKFETGYKGADSNTFVEGNKENTNNADTSKVLIKPNQYSWKYISMANMYKTSYDYNRDMDSHMMKNTEWAAIAYLAYSKYGICTNGVCSEVRINNSDNFLTGFAAKKSPTADNKTYGSNTPNQDSDISYNYNNPESVVASTTGNYSGVYDMSGGSYEYMMGIIKVENFGQTEFTEETFPKDSKYYDEYKTTIKDNDNDYTRRILGDATAEVRTWYADGALYLTEERYVSVRSSCGSDGTNAGIFYNSSWYGFPSENETFRIVLTPQ